MKQVLNNWSLSNWLELAVMAGAGLFAWVIVGSFGGL